jgi:hypothetical protein
LALASAYVRNGVFFLKFVLSTGLASMNTLYQTVKIYFQVITYSSLIN